MAGQVMERTYTDRQHRLADALDVEVEDLSAKLAKIKEKTGESNRKLAARLARETGVPLSEGTISNFLNPA